MFGWTRRCLALNRPLFIPPVMLACWCDTQGPVLRPTKCDQARPGILSVVLLAVLLYILATGARLLEIPFWDNPAYLLEGEYLLATHDAYYWTAGATGFGTGIDHPMSGFVRIVAGITGQSPANAGFWLPPFCAGLLAVAVFAWGAGLGHPFAGFVAGLIASLSPAFCARTLLGFCDTDLIILLFSTLLGLVPALWVHPWLVSPVDGILGIYLTRWKRKFFAVSTNGALQQSRFGDYFFQWLEKRSRPLQAAVPAMERSILSWPWLLALMLSGLFGYWTQEWHSFFPYLVRFSALFLPCCILVLGPLQGRMFLMEGALCHTLPLLLGFNGLAIALSYSLWLKLPLSRLKARIPSIRPGVDRRIQALLTRHHPLLVALLWTLVLLWCLDSTVLYAMKNSFWAYVHRDGEVLKMATEPLVFPSVTSSIIETQTIRLMDFLAYFYPNPFVGIMAIICFFLVLLVFPVLGWMLPLLALAFLSMYMGGRMAMFAPPPLVLGLCMASGWLLFGVWKRLHPLGGRVLECIADKGQLALFFACSLVLGGYMAWPLVTLVPAYSHGPVISQEQAAGLAFLKKNTHEEAIVWNWWDWGYATHYFARRGTIADGAKHGEAALYLPALAYSTADARLARQVIKHTALKGNVPGRVFSGMTPAMAQELVARLGNQETPLVEAPGKQYFVVSFEILRRGIWITRFGSWNFERKKSSGAIMNNIPEGLEFELATGSVTKDNGPIIAAASIDIFSPEGIRQYVYPDQKGNHFIFNMQNHQEATKRVQASGSLLVRFWEWARADGVRFTSPAGDKMVVDPIFYNTMMVRLLLGKKDDPRITPYFRCVFDNIYCRIYEVL